MKYVRVLIGLFLVLSLADTSLAEATFTCFENTDYGMLTVPLDNGLTAYVTGVRNDDALQDYLTQTLSTLTEDSSLELVDPLLVDAEKFSVSESTAVIDWEDTANCRGDTLQCWAKTTANLLWCTGWGRRAADPATGRCFAGEDEIAAYFARNFMDLGNTVGFCTEYFFTGVNPADGFKTWAHLKSDHVSAAMFPQITEIEDVIVRETPEVTDAHLAVIADALREGQGVAVTLSLYRADSEDAASHVVAVQGCVTGVDADGSMRVTHLILADSDNDALTDETTLEQAEEAGEDSTLRPENRRNCYTVYPVCLVDDPYVDDAVRIAFSYGEDFDAVVEILSLMQPYRE